MVAPVSLGVYRVILATPNDGTKLYAYDLLHEGRFVLLYLAQDAKVANELRKITLSHISYVDAVVENPYCYNHIVSCETNLSCNERRSTPKE